MVLRDVEQKPSRSEGPSERFSLSGSREALHVIPRWTGDTAVFNSSILSVKIYSALLGGDVTAPHEPAQLVPRRQRRVDHRYRASKATLKKCFLMTHTDELCCQTTHERITQSRQYVALRSLSQIPFRSSSHLVNPELPPEAHGDLGSTMVQNSSGPGLARVVEPCRGSEATRWHSVISRNKQLNSKVVLKIFCFRSGFQFIWSSLHDSS